MPCPVLKQTHAASRMRHAAMKRTRAVLQENGRRGHAEAEATQKWKQQSEQEESQGTEGEQEEQEEQEESQGTEGELSEQEEEKEDSDEDDATAEGQPQSRGVSTAVHPAPLSAILLSPVSFQHSQLRSKAFPPPPIVRQSAVQSKSLGMAGRSSAHVSADADAVADVDADVDADADADSKHDVDGNCAAPSLSSAPASPPLLRCLAAPHNPSRLAACIRQLKSELDSLRANIETYAFYVRKMEVTVDRSIMPSIMPFFTYLTSTPAPPPAFTRCPSPETVTALRPSSHHEHKKHIMPLTSTSPPPLPPPKGASLGFTVGV
jgi:hypothetical protein